MSAIRRIQVIRHVYARLTVYSAWEPYAGHTTSTHINGVRYGRVGTSPLPANLDALKPLSDERYSSVRAWYRAEYQRAYDAIIAAYPEATAGTCDMGEIEVRQ